MKRIVREDDDDDGDGDGDDEDESWMLKYAAVCYALNRQENL